MVDGDHPRRCGENYLFRFYMTPSEGSPPQVRGKPRSTSDSCNSSRITPAGAGKTFSAGYDCVRPWDHPRRCGENQLWSQEMSEKSGSPPQVRGKLNLARYNVGIYGITPAGAGKTELPFL